MGNHILRLGGDKIGALLLAAIAVGFVLFVYGAPDDAALEESWMADCVASGVTEDGCRVQWKLFRAPRD